ncbi:MAG: hypothetical protein PHX62_04890 [Bacilli bacterium]|nr:hypothetical protein [Bacilli bacterium]
MKCKTIEKILRGQFAKFLKSITDKEVQQLVKDNSIITGGAIVSLVLDEKVNDFDIYFTNRETVLAICKYYKALLVKEDICFETMRIEETDDRIKYFIPSGGIRKPNSVGKKFYPAVITDNAISLTNATQLIIRFYGDPNEIHKNYDFVHVKSYWLSSNGKLYLNPNSIEAILTKELIYEGSLYPLASLFRLRKFLSRGWTITAGDIFKIAFQISKLDFEDPKVIYDQLIGVDIHYFQAMINRIQSDLSSGKIKKVEQGYLSDLVDEIFHQSDEYTVDAYLNQKEKEEITD